MPRRPDPNLVWEARRDGIVGRVQGALWTATVDQLTAFRATMPTSLTSSTPSSSC
jgi:hypothetical protein